MLEVIKTIRNQYQVHKCLLTLSPREKYLALKNYGWIPNSYGYSIFDLHTGKYLKVEGCSPRWQEERYFLAFNLNDLKGYTQNLHLYTQD
jgi:hypothetical protein